MTDDRRDKTSFNIMQRVFDNLQAQPNASVDELCARLHLDRQSVLGGLRRLRIVMAVFASCGDGKTWRYDLKTGAQRPVDRRGGDRGHRKARNVAYGAGEAK